MTTEQQKSPISRYLLDEVSTHWICISIKSGFSYGAVNTRPTMAENEGLRGRGKKDRFSSGVQIWTQKCQLSI